MNFKSKNQTKIVIITLLVWFSSGTFVIVRSQYFRKCTNVVYAINKCLYAINDWAQGPNRWRSKMRNGQSHMSCVFRWSLAQPNDLECSFIVYFITCTNQEKMFIYSYRFFKIKYMFNNAFLVVLLLPICHFSWYAIVHLVNITFHFDPTQI